MLFSHRYCLATSNSEASCHQTKIAYSHHNKYPLRVLTSLNLSNIILKPFKVVAITISCDNRFYRWWLLICMALRRMHSGRTSLFMITSNFGHVLHPALVAVYLWIPIAGEQWWRDACFSHLCTSQRKLVAVNCSTPCVVIWSSSILSVQMHESTH